MFTFLRKIITVILKVMSLNCNEINLVLEGKNATEITKTIEERKAKQTQIANDERINNLIDQINPLLERSMEIAKLHLTENLISEDHIKTLEKNCELARDYIRQTGKIPPAIPTIDFESLAKYPSVVTIEKPAEPAKTDETLATANNETVKVPTKKRTTTKKTTEKKTSTKKKAEEKNGNDSETASHEEVPTHE